MGSMKVKYALALALSTYISFPAIAVEGDKGDNAHVEHTEDYYTIEDQWFDANGDGVQDHLRIVRKNTTGEVLTMYDYGNNGSVDEEEMCVTSDDFTGCKEVRKSSQQLFDTLSTTDVNSSKWATLDAYFQPDFQTTREKSWFIYKSLKASKTGEVKYNDDVVHSVHVQYRDTEIGPTLIYKLGRLSGNSLVQFVDVLPFGNTDYLASCTVFFNPDCEKRAEGEAKEAHAYLVDYVTHKLKGEKTKADSNFLRGQFLHLQAAQYFPVADIGIIPSKD